MAQNFTAEDRKKLTEAIGELTLRWGMVESSWHTLFMFLYSFDRQWAGVYVPVVNALYDSHRSGAGKRSMILEYARAILGDTPHMKRLGQLYAKTNDISGMRNAVQHTSFTYVGSKGVYSFEPSPMMQSKLTGKDVLASIERMWPLFDELLKGLMQWQMDMRKIPTPQPIPSAQIPPAPTD